MYIDDTEELRGAGDAFIETPTRYYIDGRASLYMGAHVNIWGAHVYIGARHDINAIDAKI